MSAVINDPDSRDKVRMVVRYSKDPKFKSYRTAISSFGRQGVRHRATMTGLSRNTLYYVRVYTQQRDRYSSRGATTPRPSGRPKTDDPSRCRIPEQVARLRQRDLTRAAVPEPVRHRVHPARPDSAAGSRQPGGVARGAAVARECARVAKVADVDSWFAHLRRTPAEKSATNAGSGKKAWEYGNDLGNWSILRRIYSERSVLETMTEFWSNHLHIPVGHDRAWVYRFDYDATIRSTRSARSRSCSIACSLHPAMRVYLDNWKSVRNKPNENQGRELLELHTVGRNAGYTEAMVKASAVLLSGYTVDWGKTFEARSTTQQRTPPAPSRSSASATPTRSADGQAATLAYLKYLANHPATARRIATKLATQFVSDSPSDGLVDTLAGVYTELGHRHPRSADGAVDPPGVPDLRGPQGAHPGRRPGRNRARARGRRAGRRVRAARGPTPRTTSTAATDCSPGRGRTVRRSTGAAWSSASRVFNSYGMHRNHGWRLVAQGGGDVPHRPPPGCPRLRCGSTPTSTTSAAPGWVEPADARLLTGRQPGGDRTGRWAIVTARPRHSEHSLAGWLFPRLVSALLDTPDHMTT